MSVTWFLIIMFGVMLILAYNSMPQQMRWIGVILMFIMIVAQFVKL